MNTVLVTQSFGKESEYRRAIFMIWSFWSKSSATIKVILFTDAPDYFDSYFKNRDVQYVKLTPDKVLAMRGSINFLHRMKIAMIEEAFNLQVNSNILYADSDTFFIDDPSPLLKELAPSKSFMHILEYAFEEIRNMPLPAGKTFRDFVSLLERQNFKLADGSDIKIQTSQSSWNAGVMLLHHSHKAFIQDVYALTNQFYSATSNHASEQYAFSIALQDRTSLQPCSHISYHYWYRVKKNIMDAFLTDRINARWANLPDAEKISSIGKWISFLPSYFDNHVWMLRDNAIQAFNDGKLKVAFTWSLRAVLRNPFDIQFIKDVSYHTKRLMFRSN